MKIGILGGTFDPPHLGHLGAAKRALDAGLVEEAWFVPCLTHRFGKAPEDFSHRLAMCALLVKDNPKFRVSDIEASLNRPGYTIDLVRRLRQDHPEHEFHLIAGTDIYHQRILWDQYNEIAKLAPPIYVARQGEPPIPEPVLEAPPDIRSGDLRAALARGESTIAEIPQPVLDYIHTHGLYCRSL